ncbi:ATP-binding protein [Egbenema bharatensis]|uniref:ATP-binding protein n=1 Tax=Egbenema bharatensis TaxID=3463334 RepID=UPI003A88229F
MSHPHPEAVTLTDILITEALSQRSSRAPNWQAEVQAMQSLARQMAQSSDSLLQSLVETALELCRAGTAGVSLVKTAEGEEAFRWVALAGTLSHHAGGSTPRHFSPCGVCLEQGIPVLFSYPERYFTYFQEANTPIVEGLVLPLVANNHALGTIWIMSHDEQRQFDLEDVRIMTSLADFTATALRLQQRQTGALLAANVVLEAEIADRKRAEVAIRQSETKYRSLFTSIDKGFTLLEMIADESDRPADFRSLETNPAWEQQTSLTNVSGKTLLEIAPDFEQPLLDFYSDVVISGRGRRTKYYTASTDRWYTVYASRIGGEGSRQVAAVFNDITERKRTEEQQAFLLKFSDALRAEPDADSVANRAVRMLAEHLHLDRCWLAEVFEQQDIAKIGWEYHRLDLLPTAGVYRLSDYPEIMRQIATQPMVIHDVTNDPDFADSEKALLAQLQIQALLVVSLRKGQHQVIWALVCTVTTARHWNESERVLLEQVSERTWAAIERARAEAALREAELQRVREQSAREEERQRAESLAELDRAKTQFFSNISHEFRTPLTLLLAPLQDVLNDRAHPLDPVHQERLELVHRNSLRLLKLVNTLLDFSRIEAGRMEAVYEPTDLAQFTADLASVFRSAIERAGLQLIVDCPPLPAPVYVDREMWEKIVLNLLSNAFKFTFTGEIRVSLHSTDRNQAILQVQDTGTGIPPEHLPHLFERFYQVRGTQERTHEGSGIGLALVYELVRLQGGTIEVNSTSGAGTCFAIALSFGTDHLPGERLRRGEADRIQTARTLTSTAMGAAAYGSEAERWLATDSKADETDNFSSENEELLKSIDLPSASSVPKSATHILVIDDNADIREYLTRILSEHVQVETVADGTTALAVAQERVPDLILSDVMMPGLDGFELLEALRADPRTREIPIILLSAVRGKNRSSKDWKQGQMIT